MTSRMGTEIAVLEAVVAGDCTTTGAQVGSCLASQRVIRVDHGSEGLLTPCCSRHSTTVPTSTVRVSEFNYTPALVSQQSISRYTGGVNGRSSMLDALASHLTDLPVADIALATGFTDQSHTWEGMVVNTNNAGSLRNSARENPGDIKVWREGRVEPLLHCHPRLSSAAAHWSGVVLEDYTVPACIIPRHEHVENFLHVVLRGSVQYEVLTRGKTFKFSAHSGTTFVLPRGTVDEIRWSGPTHRIAAALHPRLLTNALDETAHEREVELTEQWNLTDPNIMAVLLAMKTDLDAGSPAGRMYGESLAKALAVYLLRRYAVRPHLPAVYRGGLPRYRLKRVIDYIDENLSRDLTLAQLAAVAGMSPHYFAELFRQSTDRAPHQYVLLRRIDIAKQCLRDPRRSVAEAGLDAGFQNPSHFARVFRKWVGISPSGFRSESRGTASTEPLRSRDLDWE